MNKNDLIKVLAICNKIQIEMQPDLTEKDKEFWKFFVDQIEKEAHKGN